MSQTEKNLRSSPENLQRILMRLAIRFAVAISGDRSIFAINNDNLHKIALGIRFSLAAKTLRADKEIAPRHPSRRLQLAKNDSIKDIAPGRLNTDRRPAFLI